MQSVEQLVVMPVLSQDTGSVERFVSAAHFEACSPLAAVLPRQLEELRSAAADGGRLGGEVRRVQGGTGPGSGFYPEGDG